MQEVGRQTARNETIMLHWRNNVSATIQGKQGEATRAANAGFELAEQLYRDIRSGTSLVSSIAFDRLKELVRFCFSYAFGVNGTTWPECNNSIRYRHLPPAQNPEQEHNWMVERGLWLVYDLYFHLQLHLNLRQRLRRVLVEGFHFVADLCYEEELRATDREVGSQSTLTWWQEAGDQVLHFLAEDMKGPTVGRVIRDASENAVVDQLVRMRWRKLLKKRRHHEEVHGVLDLI
jgi:hypothetical protein